MLDWLLKSRDRRAGVAIICLVFGVNLIAEEAWWAGMIGAGMLAVVVLMLLPPKMDETYRGPTGATGEKGPTGYPGPRGRNAGEDLS